MSFHRVSFFLVKISKRTLNILQFSRWTWIAYSMEELSIKDNMKTPDNMHWTLNDGQSPLPACAENYCLNTFRGDVARSSDIIEKYIKLLGGHPFIPHHGLHPFTCCSFLFTDIAFVSRVNVIHVAVWAMNVSCACACVVPLSLSLCSVAFKYLNNKTFCGWSDSSNGRRKPWEKWRNTYNKDGAERQMELSGSGNKQHIVDLWMSLVWMQCARRVCTAADNMRARKKLWQHRINTSQRQ